MAHGILVWRDFWDDEALRPECCTRLTIQNDHPEGGRSITKLVARRGAAFCDRSSFTT
jgi:hypothetical protein